VYHCCLLCLAVRQAALELERVRSAKIASLPPPPRNPLDDIEPVKCEHGFCMGYFGIILFTEDCKSSSSMNLLYALKFFCVLKVCILLVMLMTGKFTHISRVKNIYGHAPVQNGPWLLHGVDGSLANLPIVDSFNCMCLGLYIQNVIQCSLQKVTEKLDI
jgi:hypothetical protein